MMVFLLAADINLGPLFHVLILAILAIFAYLNHRLGKNNESDRNERPLGGPPEIIPPQAPAAPGKEVQDFLRRAANQKRSTRPPSGPAPATTSPPAFPQPTPGRRPQRTPPPVRASSEPRRLAVVEEVVESPTEETVAEHVRRSLNTSSFEQRAESLGDRVEQADEQMEAHLKSAFDHRIGTLSGRQISADEGTSSTPASSERESAPIEIAALLADPANRRNVMILNEILSRPEHRW